MCLRLHILQQQIQEDEMLCQTLSNDEVMLNDNTNDRPEHANIVEVMQLDGEEPNKLFFRTQEMVSHTKTDIPNPLLQLKETDEASTNRNAKINLKGQKSMAFISATLPDPPKHGRQISCPNQQEEKNDALGIIKIPSKDTTSYKKDGPKELDSILGSTGTTLLKSNPNPSKNTNVNINSNANSNSNTNTNANTNANSNTKPKIRIIKNHHGIIIKNEMHKNYRSSVKDGPFGPINLFSSL
jgi:hypothetical protein